MKVFVTQPIAPEALKDLKTIADVSLFDDASQVIPREKLLDGVKDADILYCLLHDKIDAEVLSAAKNLKMIANSAIFPANVDMAAVNARKIPVSVIPNIVAEATADLQWGLLLAVARRIVFADKALRSGIFAGAQSAYFVGGEVHGKTLGSIGFGAIGQGVAKRTAGYGMRILYTKRHRLDEQQENALNAEFCSLDQLLTESDFVCVNAQLTPETRHLISTPQLEMMKNTAYLINTARGPIVDEEALVKALANNTIAGAALDVYENEPRIHPDLLRLDNAVLTPHIGSAGSDTRSQIHAVVVNNIRAFINGKKLPNLSNPEIYT